MIVEFDHEKTDVEKFSLYQTGISLRLDEDRRPDIVVGSQNNPFVVYAAAFRSLFNNFTCQISAVVTGNHDEGLILANANSPAL